MSKNNICLYLLVIFTAVSGLAVSDATAQPTCFLNVEKSAPEDPEQEFSFVAQNASPSEFTLTENDNQNLGVTLGNSATLIEEPIDGWALRDVTCGELEGVEVSDIPGGILVTCVEPVQTQDTCTFNNVMAVRSIPTISEWGVLAIVAGLGLTALYVLTRNRRRAV